MPFGVGKLQTDMCYQDVVLLLPIYKRQEVVR